MRFTSSLGYLHDHRASRFEAMTERLNPTDWSAALGFDQGQLRPAPTQLLTLAGQGSTDGDGRLLHADDTAAQLALSLSNVEEVLDAAGMRLDDVLRLTVYATDVDAVLAHFDVLTDRLAAAGATPPMTLLGVTRLALPDMVVALEATAVR